MNLQGAVGANRATNREPYRAINPTFKNPTNQGRNPTIQALYMMGNEGI